MTDLKTKICNKKTENMKLLTISVTNSFSYQHIGV